MRYWVNNGHEDHVIDAETAKDAARTYVRWAWEDVLPELEADGKWSWAHDVGVREGDEEGERTSWTVTVYLQERDDDGAYLTTVE